MLTYSNKKNLMSSSASKIHVSTDFPICRERQPFMQLRIFKRDILRSLYAYTSMWRACLLAVFLLSPCLAKGGSGVEEIRSPAPSEEKIQQIVKEAEAGDPLAMLHLGVFHANGSGVQQDYAKAAEWYLQAAAAGNAVAQRNLALLYDCGLGVERDYAKAVEWYRAAARQGEAAAFMGLGRFIMAFHESLIPPEYGSYQLMRLLAFYLCGMNTVEKKYYDQPFWPDEKYVEYGFWKDYYRQMEYFQEDAKVVEATRKKAEQGDDEAQLRMAIFIFQGQGVFINSESFAKWIVLAAKTNPRAAFIIYINKTKKWNNATKTKEPRFFEMFSSPLIADLHSEDTKEIFLNLPVEKFFSFYFLAQINLYSEEIVTMAMEGYGPAANHFLQLLKSGRRTELVDDTWYNIANINAKKGNVRSLAVKAYCLLVGLGIEQNLGAALECVQELATSNDARGLELLQDFISGKVTDCPPLSEISYVLLCDEAEREDSTAALLLGIYHQGLEETFDKSPEPEEERISVMWLKKAVNLGNPAAMSRLSTIYTLNLVDFGSFKKPFTPHNDYSDLQLCKEIFADSKESAVESKPNNSKKCIRLLKESAFRKGYLPAGLGSMLPTSTSTRIKPDKMELFNYIIKTESFSSIVSVNVASLRIQLADIIFGGNTLLVGEFLPPVRGYSDKYGFNE